MTWQAKTVGELFRVVNGGTPKTGVLAYWDGPHQWITPAEMGRLDSPHLAESRRTLTDEGLRVGAEPVPAGSIILSSRAPIGHLVINDVPMAFNQGCKGLVPSAGIDTKFAYYFFLANVDLLESLGTGTTFKELSGSKLKAVVCNYPSLAEQHRIVAILDEAFAGIATAKAAAEKSLENAGDLFDREVATLFEALTTNHPMRQIGELCDKVTVGYVGAMASRYVPTGVPFLRSQNIRPFRIDLGGLTHIDQEFHAEISKSALRPGDVAVVRTGYPGTAAVIPENLPDSNCSDLVIVRPGERLDPHFLTLFFNSDYGKRMVAGKLVGAAQKHFNVTAAKEALMPMLTRPEQAEVVKQCHELRSESQRLQSIYTRKLAALDELKQSLLRQAFSGQL